MPCRIVVCFVPTNSKLGEYSSNPFDFQRSWTVTTQNQVTEDLSLRERILEEKLTNLQSQLHLLQSSIEQVTGSGPKGKGRGKKSKNDDSGLLNRLRESFSLGNQSTGDDISVASTSRSQRTQLSTETPPPPYQEVQGVQGASKTVYIKNIELLLNGSPLDQVSPLFLFNIVHLCSTFTFVLPMFVLMTFVLNSRESG